VQLIALGLGLSRPRLGRQGSLTLLGAHVAHRPHKRDARRRCSFSFLIISAVALALGLGGSGTTRRVQLVSFTGVTLAAACSFSSLIISAAFLALGVGGKAASHCLACMQPIALTGVTLAAACSFSSIIISAAVLALGEGLLALGLGGTGRLALFGARAAHRPDRRDALAAACSLGSLIISAAALALGLGLTSSLALLGECSSWPSA